MNKDKNPRAGKYLFSFLFFFASQPHLRASQAPRRPAVSFFFGDPEIFDEIYAI